MYTYIKRNTFINIRVGDLHVYVTVWYVRLSKEEERKQIHCHFFAAFETFSLLPSKRCQFFSLMEGFAEDQERSHQQLGDALSLWEGISPGLQYLKSAVTSSWRKKYIPAFFIALQAFCLQVWDCNIVLFYFLPLPQTFFIWAEMWILTVISLERSCYVHFSHNTFIFQRMCVHIYTVCDFICTVYIHIWPFRCLHTDSYLCAYLLNFLKTGLI